LALLLEDTDHHRTISEHLSAFESALDARDRAATVAALKAACDWLGDHGGVPMEALSELLEGPIEYRGPEMGMAK